VWYAFLWFGQRKKILRWWGGNPDFDHSKMTNRHLRSLVELGKHRIETQLGLPGLLRSFEK
jgi:hypothetical protein